MKKNNILPADTYVVVNKSIIDNEDRKILTMLYQPVIGPLPIMLYFSLWSDLDKSKIMSKEYTHHHLSTNHQEISVCIYWLQTGLWYLAPTDWP